AGSTYIILNTLGATFGANLAGEVRNVQKSQLLALFGSLTILMSIWAIFYGMSYKAWGAHWTNCLMFLAGTGNEVYTSLPIGNLEPFATIMVGIMTKSGVFVFLIAAAFFMATFGSTAGMSFGPIRNIYAWGFDRMVPEALAKLHPKTSAPWNASMVAIVGAEFFLLVDIYLPAWTANIAYTIFTWFIGWIFLGIAGMVFPYRRKLLFESAPPIVKKRLFGIPVVSILGFFTLIISVAICIYLLIPFVQGLLPYTMIVVSGALFIIPLILYYYSKNQYAKKGVDIDIQFKEIPSQ
ncbi:MAG TPA: APC family permease, partial [Clostridia bacterium]|nr:APC family permease [Clostridia bacterium]